MRIWVGKEQEGNNKGALTMFIEGREINHDQEKVILNLIDKYEITRVYLGAGKTDLLHFPGTLLETSLASFEVVVECSLQNVRKWNALLPYVSELVIRIDDYTIDALSKKTVLKTDNGKVAALFYDRVINSIEAVKDGMYANDDKLVWED